MRGGSYIITNNIEENNEEYLVVATEEKTIEDHKKWFERVWAESETLERPMVRDTTKSGGSRNGGAIASSSSGHPPSMKDTANEMDEIECKLIFVGTRARVAR